MSNTVLAWLDERDIAPGMPWDELIEQQIQAVPTALICVGGHGISKAFQNKEILTILREEQKRGCKVIPVLLPGTPEDYQPPMNLINLHYVDLRKSYPDPLELLLAAIKGDVDPNK